MASSSHNIHTEAAKTEQIITEFFAKSLQIILESRCPYVSSRNFSGEHVFSSPSSSSSSFSGVRSRDKWFNLALKDSSAALENVDLWRQSNMDGMVVDIVLVKKLFDWDSANCSPKTEVVRNLSSKEQFPFFWSSDQEELGCEDKSERIIERWILQYDSRRVKDCVSGSRRSSNSLQVLYKKSILLLRSLYLTVRLLPAYKVFRDINSSGQILPFTLSHKVSSFFHPFTRKEEAEMQVFGFSPVDTSSGRLSLSVLFRPSLSDVSSEPSTPMTPKFIPDYVGSPLAEPLKRFPSLPFSHGSPSSLPFARRHSWSYDQFRGSPSSVSYSPSPTYSEPPAQPSNRSPSPSTTANLPLNPQLTSSIHKKTTSFDEYYPTPNFTPSPSPSPPIHIPGSHLSRAILKSESLPVNIPSGKLAGSPGISNKHLLPPSSPLKAVRCSDPKIDRASSLFPSRATTEKLCSMAKDEAKKLSGVKITCNNSTQISFSRSSSRSYRDDFDDTEYPCPFEVEYEDVTDTSSRPESVDRKGHLYDLFEPGGLDPIKKSQDAAVGSLVNMLRKAPPLRQDLSTLVDSSQGVSSFSGCDQIPNKSTVQETATVDVTSSGLVTLKTTADALEELQGYKEVMKDLLVSQAGRSSASTNSTSTRKPTGSSKMGF